MTCGQVLKAFSTQHRIDSCHESAAGQWPLQSSQTSTGQPRCSGHGYGHGQRQCWCFLMPSQLLCTCCLPICLLTSSLKETPPRLSLAQLWNPIPTQDELQLLEHIFKSKKPKSTVLCISDFIVLILLEAMRMTLTKYVVMSENAQRRKAHANFQNIFSPRAKKHRQLPDNLQWVLAHSICSPGFHLHRFRVELPCGPTYRICGAQSSMKMQSPCSKLPECCVRADHQILPSARLCVTPQTTCVGGQRCAHLRSKSKPTVTCSGAQSLCVAECHVPMTNHSPLSWTHGEVFPLS